MHVKAKKVIDPKKIRQEELSQCKEAVPAGYRTHFHKNVSLSDEEVHNVLYMIALVLDRRVQHVNQLGLVTWGHQRHVGQLAHVGDVEHAVVRRAVVAHQAGAIHGEDHVQVLQRDVVDDLVERAL